MSLNMLKDDGPGMGSPGGPGGPVGRVVQEAQAAWWSRRRTRCTQVRY